MSTDDPWEKLRHVTLDQLVTNTKLHGSTAMITGWTTPEGWPYGIVAFVAKPGNEAVMELYKKFLADVAALTPKVQNDQRYPPGQRPEDGAPMPAAIRCDVCIARGFGICVHRAK